MKFKSGFTGHSFLLKFLNSPAVKNIWGMQSLFFKGLEKKGPAYSSKIAVILGLMSKNGFPIKTWEEPHVSYDHDSGHNIVLTLRKSEQESIIREPMGGGHVIQ